MSKRSSSSGFTLVELLVVIGVIAVLISLLLPALNAARKQARGVVCLSQLRQLGVGFQLYAQANGSVVPFGLCRVWPNDGGTGDALYWNSFLEGADLYGSNAGDPKRALISTEAVYYCPSNKLADVNNPGFYGAVDHDDRNQGMGTFKWGSNPSKLSVLPHVRLSKLDRPTDFPLLADSTMSIQKFPGRGARAWSPAAWAVNANASSRGMLWLAHRNRANMLFADGHGESCGIDRLPTTSILNKITAGVKSYGITHWATEQMSEQTRPLP